MLRHAHTSCGDGRRVSGCYEETESVLSRLRLRSHRPPLLLRSLDLLGDDAAREVVHRHGGEFVGVVRRQAPSGCRT